MREGCFVHLKFVTLYTYPACSAAALADQVIMYKMQPLLALVAHRLDQSLEVAIVGVVLALREALDFVRDSMFVAFFAVLLF